MNEELREEASAAPPLNVATCNAIIESTSSDEKEVVRAGDKQEGELAEVNMNVQGGNVLSELTKPKPKTTRAKKGIEVTPPGAILEASDKKKGKYDEIDYNVIAHLKRIPALLSVYDALMLVPELWEALVKALLDPELYEVAMAKHRLFMNTLFE